MEDGMTRWWLLIAVLVPGGSILALAAWLRRQWLAREAAHVAEIAQLIKPPKPLFLWADEGLESRARARREIADQVKQRSALIASGSSAGSVLKMARKA
jgi:hypothetical protein